MFSYSKLFKMEKSKPKKVIYIPPHPLFNGGYWSAYYKQLKIQSRQSSSSQLKSSTSSPRPLKY